MSAAVTRGVVSVSVAGIWLGAAGRPEPATGARSEVEAEAVPAVLPGTEPCTDADAEVDC